jgi:hypothetical protein
LYLTSPFFRLKEPCTVCRISPSVKLIVVVAGENSSRNSCDCATAVREGKRRRNVVTKKRRSRFEIVLHPVLHRKDISVSP